MCRADRRRLRGEQELGRERGVHIDLGPQRRRRVERHDGDQLDDAHADDDDKREITDDAPDPRRAIRGPARVDRLGMSAAARVAPEGAAGRPVARIEAAQFGRLSAAFTITAGGGLDPTAVSLPPVGAITLAVVSRDGRQHLVQLRMPSGLRGLTVPAHGRATAVLHAVKPGRYAVEIDGLARGLVLVGGTTVSR